MSQSSMIEIFMYQVGQLFLLPVLSLVALLFVYALYVLGSFTVQALQRRNPEKLGGFPPGLLQPAPIMAAALGADAGPRGALLLALQTLSDSNCQPIR